MAMDLKKISASFRLSGLQLRPNAAKAILTAIQPQADRLAALDLIVQNVKLHLEHKQAGTAMVELDTVQKVLSKLSTGPEEAGAGPDAADPMHQDSLGDGIFVLNAFEDIPKFTYNTTRKTFFPVLETPKLHASAEAKIEIYRERYHLILQRLLRDKHFTPPVPGITYKQDTYIPITSTESLIGNPGRKYVFGMITQQEEGKFFLEDLHKAVPLDLSEASAGEGLLTEGCFVLADGEFIDGSFRAKLLVGPSYELRRSSVAACGNLDLFGGTRSPQDLYRLATMEKHNIDSMIVTLSNVHLDLPQVMEKLRSLFEGYSDIVPSMFVLMGNFTSRPFGQGYDDMYQLKGYFDELADMISEFPSLCQGSRFVFVPGPQDPGPSSVLPQPPLPEIFTQKMKEKVPRSTFSTNPCRIRHFTQEIVVFRQDLLKLMRRHCVLQPNEDSSELTDHLVKTLLDQSHLCPLPATVRPIYWEYDHAMRLYPLPDAVIIADSCDQFEWEFDKTCRCFNPGSFPSDFNFVAYRPNTKEVEFSKIP
eukprot:GILJ01010153.1.p1 GENE.GILJ01010153.1~~GILJ01010153.1.p1  ORF type:complete len:545 (+),score=81.60 GILJ01010153.1:34-1635(+)